MSFRFRLLLPLLLAALPAAALASTPIDETRPLDPDGKVGTLYGAQTTPHMYVIDTAGTLVYKGGIDSIPSSRPDTLPKAVNYVREALTAVAANKPVPNPSTRPYGCTIHYGS